MVRKDVSERVQLKKSEKCFIPDFSKVEKRIHEIQTLLESQDCESNTSTDNDTKDKTLCFTDSKKINDSIMASNSLENMDEPSPCKTDYQKRRDVIKNISNDSVSISEFEENVSLMDQPPRSQLIYSSHKSVDVKKPFGHKTPTPENNVAPLTMKFDLGKLDDVPEKQNNL